MARTYKRSANGRFAGGGGGGSTASRGASAKPKAAVSGKKKVTKKKVTAQQRVVKVAKFVKKHPRGVGQAIGVTAVAAMHHREISNGVKYSKALKTAAQYAQRMASDKKGIGSNKPGQGLKSAKKRNGAYKIRSS